MNTDTLYRSILANPEDDSLRLQYADMIESDDPVRTQLIRTQIAIAQCDEDDARLPALVRQESDLFQRLAPLSLGANATLSRDPSHVWANAGQEWSVQGIFGGDNEWRFRRGFPEIAQFRAKDFTADPPGIMRRFPIRSLYVHGLYRRSEMAHWEQEYRVLLDMYDRMYGAIDCVAPLAACQDLRGLTAFGVNCRYIANSGVVELLQTPHFINLDELLLDLSGKHSSAIGEALATSPLATSISKLKVLYEDEISYSGNFGDSGAKALANSKRFKNLRHIELQRGHVGVEGMMALLESTSLPHLKHLDLRGNPIGAEGLKALASCKRVSHLEWLGLSAESGADMCDLPLNAEAMNELIRSPHLSMLRGLQLLGNSLGEAGAQELAKWPGLAQIRELNLGHNKIGDAGMESLAISPHAAGLRVLDVGSNKITSRGIRALAASPYLARLTSLSIAGNPFGIDGLTALLQSPNLRNVRKLWLSMFDDGFGDDGLTLIANSPNLRSLNEIMLSAAGWSEARTSFLKAAENLPCLCDVLWA